jgi:hypothetical protein
MNKELHYAIDGLTEARNELIDMTEQRDRLQLIVDEGCRVSSLCREYREQRDRLAEALRKAISWGDSASYHILDRQNINWTYLNEAKEALQSLNKPTETKTK